MANVRDKCKVKYTCKRKKTTSPKRLLKLDAEKDIELELKLLRAYQVYYKE